MDDKVKQAAREIVYACGIGGYGPELSNDHPLLQKIETIIGGLLKESQDMAEHWRQEESKAVSYAIYLQRAIESHCRGQVVPECIVEQCKHHARMLNTDIDQ